MVGDEARSATIPIASVLTNIARSFCARLMDDLTDTAPSTTASLMPWRVLYRASQRIVLPIVCRV
eukprot:2432477-Lingulodinium_polyedra.AAC.1